MFSELSAGGLERDVEKTPKCTHSNSIKARQSTLHQGGRRLWLSDDDDGDCSCVFPVLHFNEGQLCTRYIVGGFVIYVNSHVHEQYHLKESSLL